MGNCFYKTSVSTQAKFLYPSEYKFLNLKEKHPVQLNYSKLKILFQSRSSYLYLKPDLPEIIKVCIPEYKQCLQSEIQILKNLSHNNIIQLKSYTPYYIVLEYLQGGDLYEYIKNDIIAEHLALPIASQINSALSYLHSKKIIHRDIKPENCVFTDITRKHIKIIDFGLATPLQKKYPRCKHKVGTAKYIAPETYGGYIGTYNDIWSLGITLFLMLTGSFPFPSKHCVEGVYKNRSIDVEKLLNKYKKIYDLHISENSINILNNMLCVHNRRHTSLQLQEEFSNAINSYTINL